MDIPKNELVSVLQEFNPWWSGQPIGDLPTWERTASREIAAWLADTQSRRALLLTGARQVGKTTLLRQAVRRLLAEGFPAANLLYATFDHPILKLAGVERTLQAWEEFIAPLGSAPRMLFLDEIQYVPNWQTWLKHQVDFKGGQRIAVTGSAMPLRSAAAESGVGRWQTIALPTLSFAEYLRVRQISIPTLPEVRSLRDVFDWDQAQLLTTAAAARPLTPHFHEYLLRSGFPEPALVEDLARCQRLLREDIVDKVLKRDLTAHFGVRRILEVEKLFLYLCYHDGGILDLTALSGSLDGVNKSLATNFLDLFEATHLVYRLKPFGYGKEVLRGRDKIYLADAALPGATLLLGRKLLQQPDKLGAAVETAFFKHVFTRYYAQTPTFSYWRDRRRELEVDLIAQIGTRLVPFEVKYQDTDLTPKRLKGLRLFLEERSVEHGYVIGQRAEDLRVMETTSARPGKEHEKLASRILIIPAPLACYWLST